MVDDSNESGINDGVIIIRPFQFKDAEIHLKGEDEELVKWLNEGKRSTVESVRNWIAENRRYWQKDGSRFTFAIETFADHVLVGMVEANIDFKNIEGLMDGDANISYGLYQDTRGKGYASRAVVLLLGFLRRKGIKRAVLRIHPKNKDSLKIPKRFRFEKQGVITTSKNEIFEIFTKAL